VGGTGLSGAPVDRWFQLTCQVVVGRLAHRIMRCSARRSRISDWLPSAFGGALDRPVGVRAPRGGVNR
jgi:hypothetical protein